MGEGFFLSGLASNACVQAQDVVVSSEDTLFPKANLQNGNPWKPFRFSALTANPTIEFDCNIIANPSYEADPDATSPPSSWIIPTGGGTPDVSTAEANEGTNSLRLNAANEAAYQDRIVRLAGTYRHTVALRGDGTNIVSAYVLDLISGKWLQSGGTWTTTKTAWATRSTATFATSSITLTLEAPVDGHVGPGRLRILFDRPGTVAGAAYVDSVYMWPKITTAAFAYHTIPTGFPIAVESADDVAFSTNLNDHGDLPARAFRTYMIFAGPATPQRFWRFPITGTPHEGFLPAIGQPILGERETMLQKPSWGLAMIREMPKSGSADFPTSLADAPRYRFDMSWESPYSRFQQIAEKLLGACSFGDEPVFIVADEDDPEMVYGRGASMSTIAPSWIFVDSVEYSLTVRDDQYSVATK